ncbi:MAG: sulfatase, partial [Planctomycetota bacterium]
MQAAPSRRHVLGMLGVAGVAGALSPAHLFAAAQRAGRKHVLHIVVDDLRCSLGCYGDTHAITPNLDKFAAGGTLFERAYVQQAVCAASRASVLTGTRPSTTGVDYPYNDAFIEDVVPQHPTFPTHFEREGAWSRMLGKIHHHRVREIEEVDAPPFNGHIEGRTWRDYSDLANQAASRERTGPPWEAGNVEDDGYKDGRVTNEAIRLLAEYDRERPDQPLFMSVGYLKPHLPFNAPRKYFDLYDASALPDYREVAPNGAPDYAHVSYELRGDQYQGAVAADDGRVDDDDAKNLTHAYYACVSYVDAQIGKLLQALEDSSIADDTVVVLWGDHGFHLGEQQAWGKHMNYEMATRVPFIWSGVGVPKGRRVDDVVELLDLYPTLCELAGTTPPAGLEGKSLVRLMRGRAEENGVAFSEYGRGRHTHGYAIRTDRWRYIEWVATDTHEIRSRQLFDHASDAGDTVDVAQQYADVVADLSKRIAKQFGL